MTKNLTEGSLKRLLFQFSIPYLISSFLQTFYGLADLYFAGRFNSASVISAVSIGSQLMHMLTVIIVGLAMGTTVGISHHVGADDKKGIACIIGNSVIIFMVFSVLSAGLLIGCRSGILSLLSTPAEAFAAAKDYITVCFIGIPFITAYNVISSIFRGLGDSRTPLYFVAIAGVINIFLDYLLMGPLSLGADGAALATVIAQSLSVVLALIALIRRGIGVPLVRQDFRPTAPDSRRILGVGVPIALQDGLIQISFLVITAIANSRGVAISAAVGIVEKIICFLFLVPSAMLSTVSVAAAQNRGAGRHDRAREALRLGIGTCLIFGSIIFVICQIVPEGIVALFTKDAPVITYGGQYLRSYSVDCAIAGVHFCFSGFFSAYEKSIYSFIHNMLSVALIRIPGTYLASVLFPATLLPMGLAAPTGSLLSVVICVFLYRRLRRSAMPVTSR